MAALVQKVHVRVRLPWWLRPYLAALRAFASLGMLHVDPDAVAEFITRHIRIEPVGRS